MKEKKSTKKPGRLMAGFSKAIAWILRLILRSRYRVKVHGQEIFEGRTPVLFLPNHQALIDPFILLSQIYRFSSAIPVISEKYFDIPLAKWYFQQVGAVRVSDLETGNRDTQVLKSIIQSVFDGFRRNTNIVIYPGGQLAAQGYERIFNKKSAYHIVEKIPDQVLIVGVRITGLWGSMWSKAGTGKTPSFFLQLFKGIVYVLANLLFFVPKREVSIEFEDLSQIARERVVPGQKAFNEFLEEFYNWHGEEPKTRVKYYFFLPDPKTRSRQL
jgi:1-acyl-sn-glycerol-3-phosphate acyltransferase